MFILAMPKSWSNSSRFSSKYSSEPTSDSNLKSRYLRESKIFISYARPEDQQAALRLYNDLKNAGLNPWLDINNLLPGQNWKSEIRRAIENSAHFIAIFSYTSVWKIQREVQNEFNFAWDVYKNLKDLASTIFFIPVRLDDCNIPEEMRSEVYNATIEEYIHYVDLFPYDENWREGVEKIIQTVNEDAGRFSTETELMEKADDLCDSERYYDAIECYDRVLHMNPNSVIAHFCKGDIWMKLQKPDKAIECYNMALERVERVLESYPDQDRSKLHNWISNIVAKKEQAMEMLQNYR
jgi:tetratricopeptide (TPR) repeat protein